MRRRLSQHIYLEMAFIKAPAEKFGIREKTELIRLNIAFGTHSDQRLLLVSSEVSVTFSSSQAARFFTSEEPQEQLAPTFLT